MGWKHQLVNFWKMTLSQVNFAIPWDACMITYIYLIKINHWWIGKYTSPIALMGIPLHIVKEVEVVLAVEVHVLDLVLLVDLIMASQPTLP